MNPPQCKVPMPCYQLTLMKYPWAGRGVRGRALGTQASGAVGLHNSHPDRETTRRNRAGVPSTPQEWSLPHWSCWTMLERIIHHILSFHKRELELTF